MNKKSEIMTMNISYIEIIFSKQRLQYLRRYFSQTQHRDHVSYFTNALTSILIRIISTSQDKEIIVSLVEKIYNDYLALLAWQYFDTSSWLTIKILTILTRILNRNVQSEFILAYKDQLENTYYYKPIPYLPQGRRNAQVQIRQLNFIKSHLIEIYKFILENIPYSTFTNALNNSDTPRDFKEVFWYFCNDEDWKEEAKNYAQSKLDTLSERLISHNFFDLAVMCKQLPEEQGTLLKHVERVLNKESQFYGKDQDDDEISKIENELRELERIDLAEVKLVFQHKKRIEELKKSLARKKSWRARSERNLEGYEKASYDYLTKWFEGNSGVE